METYFTIKTWVEFYLPVIVLVAVLFGLLVLLVLYIVQAVGSIIQKKVWDREGKE